MFVDDSRPIFLQIAEAIENDILSGALQEETQVPSTNEFAAFHRINPDVVKKEVEAAGFKFAGASTVLHNPKDPHNIPVFDKSIRGKTDQFVFKFVKPRK